MTIEDERREIAEEAGRYIREVSDALVEATATNQDFNPLERLAEVTATYSSVALAIGSAVGEVLTELVTQAGEDPTRVVQAEEAYEELERLFPSEEETD